MAKVKYEVPGRANVGLSDSPLVVVTLTSIDPECIAYHRFPRVGDTISYTATNCVRLGDGAATTFSLDSDTGVPSIVGVNGSLGYKHGVYECTISFNGGADEVIPITHLDDAAIRALYTFPAQDANGWSIVTPSNNARLIYLSPTGNNATAGPNGDGSPGYYTMSNQPPGGWEDPTSVNAYQTVAAALADMRTGFDDQLLLEEVEHDFSALVTCKSGASVTERQMFRTYGDHTARAHINPSHNSLNGAFYLSAGIKNVGFLNLYVYPTYKDPDHGDFVGWGGNTEFGPAITSYSGGYDEDGGVNNSGYLVENCWLRFCDSAMALSGGGGTSDVIFRRNITTDCYNQEQHSQGFSSGSGEVCEHYIGDCVFDHNGWYKLRINVTGTASAGSTTEMTDTGAFTGVDYTNVPIKDETNGGTATVTSNNDNQLFFDVTANVDFTGGGSYTLGGGDNQGQATIFNHNLYVRAVDNSIIEKNIITRASSIAIKTTADAQAYNANCDSGSTSHFIDADGEFTAGKENAVADDAMIGWYVSDEDNVGNGIVTGNNSTTGRVDFTVSSGTMDFTTPGTEYLVTRENTGTYPTDGLIESWNLTADNEIGLGGGGNSAYSIRSRFRNFRCTDNIQINQGATNQTLRNVGWGFGATDWLDGTFGNNIILKTASNVTNHFGFGISEITQNCTFAANIVYDLGPTSGNASNAAFLEVSGTLADFDGNYIVSNDFQAQNNDNYLVEYNTTAGNGNFTFDGNRYYTIRSAATWGTVDAADSTYANFISETGETNSTNTKVEYLDPGASIPNYQTLRGGTATQQAFIDEQRAKQMGSWDTTLNAEEVVAYFKRAFSDKPDVKYEVKALHLSNVVGTEQTVSLSAGFGTVKGIIAIRSALENTAGEFPNWGEAGGNANVSIGFHDGTNYWCTNPYIDSEVTPGTKTARSQRSDALISRKQSYDTPVLGTSTGGSTTTMIDTGAGFTEGQHDGRPIKDEATGGIGRITDTDAATQTITFTVEAGSLDFSGGVDYRIGTEGIREAYVVSDMATEDEFTIQCDYCDPPSNYNRYVCMFIAIGGDDIDSVMVGNGSLGTGTSEFEFSTGHDDADLLFATSVDSPDTHNPGETPPGSTATTDARISFGAVINDGTATPPQRSVAWDAVNQPSGTPSQCTSAIYNDALLARVFDGGNEEYTIAAGAFTSNGINLTPSANTADTLMGYISIKYKRRVNQAFADYSVPATTGNVSVTDIAFRGGFCFTALFLGPSAYNTATDITNSLGLAAFDGNEVYTVANPVEDNTTQVDNASRGSMYDSIALQDASNPATDLVTTSSNTFTDAGVDMTVTKNHSADVLSWMLVIGSK